MSSSFEFLSAVPEFSSIVQWAGPRPKGLAVPVADRFAYVVRSVVYQQLAGSAARAIHERLTELTGEVSPSSLRAFSSDQLRAVGLSGAKVRTIHALRDAAEAGNLHFATHGRMSDSDIIAELVKVHGIGPWTAQMYLMNALQRPDVWPIGDLGVRQGWSLLHGLEAISPKELSGAAAHLTGHRSLAAWFCWRAVDRYRQG
jgi:DNA-3-methyladenine glycosylase II